MNEELQKYIDSIKKEIRDYKNSSLQTKDYLQIIKDIDKWLDGKSDENNSN